MLEIQIAESQRQSGELSSAQLTAAVAAIREDGFVILLGATELAHVDALNARMMADRAQLDAAGKTLLPLLRGNQAMPRDPEYLFADIVKNAFVAQILRAVMGGEAWCGMYASNVSLPGCGEQELHVDQAPRQAEDPVGYPTNCMVVNTALVDFTLENGATEVWPGTHMVPCSIGSRYPDDNEQAARRVVAPPVRACMPRGALLLRDIRLWHRGTANRTDIYRAMVAMIAHGGYLPAIKPRSALTSIGIMPNSARDFFATGPIYYNPEFTPDPIDLAAISQK